MSLGRTTILLLVLFSQPALAGEPLVVRNTDKPLWDKTHRIEFVENLRIGGDEDESEVFGRSVALAVDSQGRIIAADYSQNVVRRYDKNGELLGTIGRGGDGPGEYRNVWALTTDSKDGIYIAGQGRISIFDASGAFVRDFIDESHAVARSVRVLADASLLLAEFDFPTHTALQKYVDGKRIAGFCEAQKLADDMERALMGFLGGYCDVGRDGMIYYTQTAPYEIRKYTPAGELVMRVLRENDFVELPRVEIVGDGTRIHYTCGSYGIVVLDDGRFLNIMPAPPEGDKPGHTTIDLFDPDGRLLLTRRFERPMNPQCLDRAGNVYTFDSEALAIVRARMTIH